MQKMTKAENWKLCTVKSTSFKKLLICIYLNIQDSLPQRDSPSGWHVIRMWGKDLLYKLARCLQCHDTELSCISVLGIYDCSITYW